MKKKRVLSLLLAAVMVAGTLSACGQKTEDEKKDEQQKDEQENDGEQEDEQNEKDDVVEVIWSLGSAIPEGEPGYETFMESKSEYEEKYPGVTLEPSSYSYDVSNFAAKALGNTLPTTWGAYFTEIDYMISNGYCADITEYVEEAGLVEVYNPDMLALVTTEDGKIWGLPYSGYAQGLHINKTLFEEAGLVNEDGSVMVPQTWEELSEYAGIIREKTGKAGFVMPTVENCGGWHFVNVAWAYGTDFMEQNKDGTWAATFYSDEFIAACNWLYDLRWNKDGIYLDEVAITNGDREQIFGVNNAAMMIANPPANGLSQTYGMDLSDFMCVSLPAGPEGRYAQTGGAVKFFNPNATPDEIRAALNWYMEYEGWNTVITEESIANSETGLQDAVAANQVIMAQASALPTFTNREGEEKLNALYEQYTNVDAADYADYLSFEDVNLQPEEPMCCQALYSILDGVVQEILTNKDIDLDAVVKTAVEDFQVNHLDQL